MKDELSAQYEPAAIEGPLYSRWRREHRFHQDATAAGEPFVIQMPPPNVTAVLHAGHGLNNTVQDVVIRFQRMRGRKAVWIPGTDHAGIATQNVVEKLLALEGQTRFDIGRDAFVARVWDFVDETGSRILGQLAALGAACDWERTYFTLDSQLSRAVREAFVTLYDEGLIYRGRYIINWCPRCLTALSNEEVEKEEVESSIWHLRYPLTDGSGSIVVATTRPETMLGDTGVAVHPEDHRYQSLVGKSIALPLTDREIPIISDEAVERDFGSGAVKLTPAHDQTDFEIGRRHGLEAINILTENAHINDAVPERFRGLDRFVARSRVVAEMNALGLLVKTDSHRHAVGHCYRCHTVVEPRYSDQWFVRMQPLAAPALAAYRDGGLRFIPERQGENYAAWLEQIRDWCISRQLWWGHRIPVWYCDDADCGRTVVSREDPTVCPGCGGPLRQDEDVLDTWFSSWLLPFSSLGWPEETADLRAFYPGNALVTAPEIIFFWVARMVMSGLHFRGQLPFDTVYLHGTVRDTQHRKMSKSLGNGIDPLEVIERFGADALRYTMVSRMAVGTDVILDPTDLETSFAPGRNFANKLWNIGRFLLGHLETDTPRLAELDPEQLTTLDRWILDRADSATHEVTNHYERYRLNDVAASIHKFLWGEFADWYLEAAKLRLYGDGPGRDVARGVAAHVFETALRLLHPVMPFVTEELWLRLPHTPTGGALIDTPWPTGESATDSRACEAVAAFQAVVGAIRGLRAEYGVAPGRKVSAVIVEASPTAVRVLQDEADAVRRLASLDSLLLADHAPDQAGATVVLEDGTTVIVPLGDLVDLERECTRLGAEVDKLADLIDLQQEKLANEKFTSRAPTNVISKEREKLELWRSQAESLRQKRRALECPD